MSGIKLDDVKVKSPPKKRSKKDRPFDPLRENLGTRRIPKLRMAKFPNADEIIREGLLRDARPETAVDIVLVNPPTPDGDLWIRTQHRVGRRTRENMVCRRLSWRRWPPCWLLSIKLPS